MAHEHCYVYDCETCNIVEEWREDKDGAPTVCDNDSGHTVDWNTLKIVASRDVLPYVTLNFSDGTNPWYETQSTDWVTVGSFRYDIDDGERHYMHIVVDKIGTADNARVRVRNIDENNSLFLESWNEEGYGTRKDSINNQPTQSTIMEVQVKVQNAADIVRLYSAMIY